MNKKLLFGVLIIGLGVKAQAQTTLTAVNFNPVIGNVFANINCDTTGITQGASGAGITWDFTSLISSSADTAAAVACSSTPGCSLYTGSSYAIVTNATDVVSYYIANATMQEQDGYYASADSNAVYSVPMVQFEYPFTYNTTFSNPYAGILTYGSFSPHESGTVTVTCDGYGTLQLPFGITDTGVLRVHTSQFFVDSASLFGIDTVATFDLETYSWYMANYHSPLMTILTTTQVGGTYANKAVSYSTVQLPNLSTPVISGIGASLQTYPNPVTENELNILYTSAMGQQTRITLSDILGREVAVVADQFIQGTQHITFNTAALPKGVYLLHSQSASETITRKVEIQ